MKLRSKLGVEEEKKMRNPNRLYEFYSELQKIHITYFPDWRFGQLMFNFLSWLENGKNIDPFYLEENEMMKHIREYVDISKGNK